MNEREEFWFDTLQEIAFMGMDLPAAFGDCDASAARFYKRQAYNMIAIAARALNGKRPVSEEEQE